MNNIFDNPILKKMNEFGQKLGQNKFISSMQAGMMGNIATLMVGSIFSILCSLLLTFGILTQDSVWYQLLYLPYQYTSNIISIWIGATIAYTYARHLKLRSPLVSAINSVITFMIVAGGLVLTDANGVASINMTYLGAQGMFACFAVVWIVCRIEKFCTDKNISIKLPDAVPPSLAASFNAIIPLFLSIVVVEGINTIILVLSSFQLNMVSGFMALLSAPLKAVNSVPGIIAIMVFACILWLFGIHGSMIIFSVLMAPMIQAITDNATAYYTVGLEALKFYPIILFGCIQMCGGTGNTLPMAIFGMRSKSEQIKAVSRISFLPGWFGINEPMTFGYPIMYNPVLGIPYILSVVVLSLLTWGAYSIGFLTPAFNYVGVSLPMGFGGLLGALSWKNFIWDYIMLAVDCVIWYPFFKAFEKQCIEEEAARESE
ncbi:MAG: PTS sugar transporter subunit IIC [Erysipelotrichaceae bacterium]|nr:PTS sugar transporter subunit IIC [Erysipelotrichaceae bacterium]